MRSIVNTVDLKAILGYTRAADIERCLRDQGITVFWSRLGPWTTIELINQAGGLKPANNDDEHFKPEDVI